MHNFNIQLEWTGNKGLGTQDYKAYSRDHKIGDEHKSSLILGTSDPNFRGDPSRYNPEELLIASLSSCHMLWYLHLCADNGIVVLEYNDNTKGQMRINSDGSGEFELVVLCPKVRVKDPSMISKAEELHERAHEMCFIARSVGFEVKIEARVES
ncbi:MAG: OsmC family protein [Bacteroidota bacterium]